MRLHPLVPLVAALANLLICVLVLRHRARERLIRSFAWMTLTLVAWNLDVFSLYYFTEAADAEWYSRLFRTGLCFAPVAACQFALSLAETRGGAWRGVLAVGYATGTLLTILNLRGSLVSGVELHTWGWYPKATGLYGVLSTFLTVYLGLTLERIWHAHRHASSPRQRVQAKFCLIAVAAQAPFVFTNLLPFLGIKVYPLADVGNVLYIGIIAYAIVRHRVMDVDYVVRKIVSFAAAAAAVLVPGGIGIALLGRALGADEPVVLTCATLATALLAALLIPILQGALETHVHRAFFPQRYHHHRRLRQLAAELVHVLDEGRLVAHLGAALTDILDVESCEVFLREEHSARLTRRHPALGAAGALPDDLGRGLEHLPGPVLASELQAMDAPTAAELRAHGWEAVVPLRTADRLRGVVALGRNQDFRIFSSEDLKLLESVAAGASVALENACLSRQLRRSEAVLERANRLSSIGMLAAGIAHEIRNPLVAVKTFLDLLPQRLDDREFLSRFRDLSLSEIRRVTDLIADLLALGKAKAPERRVIDLASTLEPVLRLMESTARKRRVELNARFEAELPMVWADPDQLKQIVLNLVLNAIETSPAGGHVTLRVAPGAAGGAVLEVGDEGPGIPPDQLEAIFHPFYTTKETGTGLGLTLVHQMVVEHGGEITVESEVGRGSVFRVTLPGGQLGLAPTGT